MDGWKKAQTVDIDNYSAMVAVGGDGTLHEVVNGMMFRADKKRVPIAFLPNGSGNDTCKSIGCHSVEQALAYLKKGNTIKVDLNRVYIDCDSFESVAEDPSLSDEEKYRLVRYSLINASVGFIAKIVHSAQKVKLWAG